MAMNPGPTPSRPRLLMLTSQLSYPPHQGATIRSYNLLRELARRSDIDLLSFVSDMRELDAAAPLRALCRSIEAIPVPRRSLGQRIRGVAFTVRPDMALRFWSQPFAELLARRLQRKTYDATLFVGIDMGPYLEQVSSWRTHLPAGAARPMLIFDDLNAEYLLQQRAFETDLHHLSHPRRWAGALYSLIQWRRLRRFEARLCRLADHVVAVSDADQLALKKIVRGLDVTVVPNGVDLERYRPAVSLGERKVPAPALVFTGKMDFRPNVDAACWFADEVLPLIMSRVPETTFAIVGRDPHPRVRALASRPGVRVTGYVEDDIPYFADATVYVVPLRVGGGTRLKVLAAMAMEDAIVSTSLGCEGLGALSGRELVIAEDAVDFAEQTVALLKDADRRRALGTRARQFVEERYGWPAIAPRLEQLYLR